MQQAVQGTWHDAAPGRPLWKTWLVCALLCVIPVVGWSMATCFWLTRHDPSRYDAGAAAVAGLVVFGMALTPWLLLMLVFIF